MFKFPKMKRSLVLMLAFLLSFSLLGCTAEELETAGEIIGTVADIAESVANDSAGSSTAEDSEEDITDLPVEEDPDMPETEDPVAQAIEPEVPAEKNEPEVNPEDEDLPAIDRDGIYTTKEDVSLYLWTYGELPRNFMTKSEARKLGWPGGGLDEYAQDMCIGGDTFGNREGLLPQKYKYIECDIDTLNQDDRGSKRIVFSKDCEVIYYTPDHYESFELLYGEE